VASTREMCNNVQGRGNAWGKFWSSCRVLQLLVYISISLPLLSGLGLNGVLFCTA
jgi:hypothetical protein